MHVPILFVTTVIILSLNLVTVSKGEPTDNAGEAKSSPNKPLYVLSLLPGQDKDRNSSTYYGLVRAGQLAVDLINNSSDLLTGYSIELILGNSGCEDSSLTEQTLIHEVFYGNTSRNIVGIVGPLCADSMLAVSSLTARPEISLPVVSVSDTLMLEDREAVRNSFSTLGSSKLMVKALVALMKTNSWDNVQVFYDASLNYYKDLYNELQTAVAQSDSSFSVFPVALFDQFSLIQFENNTLTNIRISIILAQPVFVQRLLCLVIRFPDITVAYPQYQSVIISDLTESASIINSEVRTFSYLLDRYSCTVEEMRPAFERSIFLTYHLEPDDVNVMTDTGISFAMYRDLLRRENVNVLEPFTYHASAYFDAIWSLAFALNNTAVFLNLSEYGYGQDNKTMLLHRQLETLNFTGVSGTINFNNSTGFTNRNVNIFQVVNGALGLDPLEYYDSTTNSIERYGDGSVEYVSGTFDKYIYAELWIGIGTVIVTVVIAVILIAIQVLNITHSKYHSIKASSPRLTHFAFVGCYIVLFSLIIITIGESFGVSTVDNKCDYYHAYLCLQHLGWTVFLATLCARTFRIYRIFVHYLKPGRLITNVYLIVFVLVIVGVMVLLLVGISVIELPSPITVSGVQGVEVVVSVRCRSTAPYIAFSMVILVYQCFLALQATVFAALTVRKIKLKDFQVDLVIFLCFILLFLLGLFILLEFTYNLTYNLPNHSNQQSLSINRGQVNYTLIFGSLYQIARLFFCLILLFIPPISPLLHEKFKTELIKRNLITIKKNCSKEHRSQVNNSGCHVDQDKDEEHMRNWAPKETAV